MTGSMISLLLAEKNRSKTIFRFKTLVTWLSVNSMNTDSVDEVLQMFDFVDFTFKELSSDVRKSGLYPTDQIMERMDEIFQGKVKELDGRDRELKDLAILAHKGKLARTAG